MRIKAITIALIAAATTLTLQTSADASFSQCDSNKMCMWGNNDFKWLIGERVHGVDTTYNMPSGTNDEMDSWGNRSARFTGCMYANKDGGGDKQTMGRGSSDNNVSPLNSDEVSSWRSKNGC